MNFLKTITLVMALAVLLIFSCAKQADFTPSDKDYIFVLKDLENVDLSGYTNKINNGNNKFFFTKNKSKLNGLLYFYGETLEKGDNKIRITTSLNIQSTKVRARQLYDSLKDSPVFSNNDKTTLDNEYYKCDDIVMIKTADFYTIEVVMNELYYTIQIEGIKDLNEDNFKNNLKAKLFNVYKNYSGA